VIKWGKNSKEGQVLLYILTGEDDYSLYQSLEEIKKGLGDPELLAANTTVLDGQQVNLSQLRTISETLPFLAEKRLVIVNGLLERFEPKGKPGRKKTSTQPDHKNDYKLIADHIGNLPESTILVLVDSSVSGHNPLFKGLTGKGEVRSFPWLRGAKLRQWIQNRVKAEGSRISPPAVELLARMVGSNLWIVASEINKLTLYTAGRDIEEGDVKSLVSHAQQASVFNMVDAILEFKVDLAEQILQQLLRRGAAPAYLLVMLSRQVQMLVRARELRNQGKTKAQIQSKLGIALDFVLNKTLELADRYTLSRLKEVYHQLLEADLSIKTGKYESGLALDILIAELCRSTG